MSIRLDNAESVHRAWPAIGENGQQSPPGDNNPACNQLLTEPELTAYGKAYYGASVEVHPLGAAGVGKASRENFADARKWCSSALSRGLGEKRLVLGHNFGALTLWTSSCFFLVLADGHRQGETLVTLFATILVNRHRGVRSTWLTRLYPALRDVAAISARP